MWEFPLDAANGLYQILQRNESLARNGGVMRPLPLDSSLPQISIENSLLLHILRFADE